jgi:hypothetical protein
MRFQSGNNSGGRPKGSRNKVGAAFFDVLLKVMLEPVSAQPEGTMSKLEESLRTLHKREPLNFVKTIVNTLPQQIEFESPASALPEDELFILIQEIRQSLPPATRLLEAKRDKETIAN